MSTYDGAYSNKTGSSDSDSWMGYVPVHEIVKLERKNLNTAEYVRQYKELVRRYQK